MVALLQHGLFRLASGIESNLRIECDALDLDEENWQTAATLIRHIARPYNEVIGVPNGGLRLSKYLVNYATPSAPHRLIVDDVWTTGGSASKYRQPGDQCIVLFARGPLGIDTEAIFKLHHNLMIHKF